MEWGEHTQDKNENFRLLYYLEVNLFYQTPDDNLSHTTGTVLMRCRTPNTLKLVQFDPGVIRSPLSCGWNQ